jgi:hypothetical protein
VLLAAALAGYPLAYAGGLTAPAALLAAFGLLFVLAAVVFRARSAVGPGLFALAAEYVLAEVTGRVATASIVGYAVGLVILAEIVLWQGMLPSPARMDTAVLTRWLRGVVLIGLGGAVLAVVVLAGADLAIPGAISGAIAGSGAGILLLAIPWLLLTKRPDRVGHAKGRSAR